MEYDFLSWKFNRIFDFLFVEILVNLWNLAFWMGIEDLKVEALSCTHALLRASAIFDYVHERRTIFERKTF